MNVDLCVVNYNTRPLLERMVETLHSDVQDFCQPWNLYIADNGSTDDTLKWLESRCADRPPVGKRPYYIRAAWDNPNIGYAAACNQLAAHGHAEIIGLLNADVWLTTGDVEAIVGLFEKYPEMSILGPKQRDEEGRVVHGGIFGTLERPVHRGWKVPDPEDLQFKDHCQAVTVSGSAYFIRRSAWETLKQCSIYRSYLKEVRRIDSEGAFLPTPHYYEETFCSYHASAHGLKVYYNGTVSIGHSWHASHPVGSPHDQLFHISQALFREACDYHNIPHD